VVCRERPSTVVTNAEAEAADFSDPLFPPDVQVEHRYRGPHVDELEDVRVSAIDDDGDDRGVAA